MSSTAAYSKWLEQFGQRSSTGQAYSPASYKRDVRIYLPNDTVLRNWHIVAGSLQIDENLCQKKEFKFGGSEQSHLQFKTSVNLTEWLGKLGGKIRVNVRNDRGDDFDLGEFILTACKRDTEGMYSCEGYSAEQVYSIPNWLTKASNLYRTSAAIPNLRFNYLAKCILKDYVPETYTYESIEAHSTSEVTATYYRGHGTNCDRLQFLIKYTTLDWNDFEDLVYIPEAEIERNLDEAVKEYCARLSISEEGPLRFIRSGFIYSFDKRNAVDLGYIYMGALNGGSALAGSTNRDFRIPLEITVKAKVNGVEYVSDTFAVNNQANFKEAHDPESTASHSALWEVPIKSKKVKSSGVTRYQWETPEWMENPKEWVDDYFELNAAILCYGRSGNMLLVHPNIVEGLAVCGTFTAGEMPCDCRNDACLIEPQYIHKGAQYQATDVTRYGAVCYDVAQTVDGKVQTTTKGYTFGDGAAYYIQNNHFLTDVDHEALADAYIEEVFSVSLGMIGFAQVKATTELLPWVKAGDNILLSIGGKKVPTIVLKKTTKGVNGGTDTFDTSSAVVDYSDKMPEEEE